jgi:hypothetical protein
MAARLHAIHRWAVSGTPIKTSFNDLQGLLVFLQCEEIWYEDTTKLLQFLKKIMWRHVKSHVQVCHCIIVSLTTFIICPFL